MYNQTESPKKKALEHKHVHLEEPQNERLAVLKKTTYYCMKRSGGSFSYRLINEEVHLPCMVAIDFP